ncbi:MAG TPA: hypothetical protein VEI48_06390 [Candidatus Sulfotelmatobacter sp.]|nr:hypothetical protein [Candidatus Sulfotelmatobacter sp.]
MAKGDRGKGSRKTEAGPASKAAGSATDDKTAKAEKRRARKVVKVELQLADAREIQAAVGALVASLEHKLAELRPPLASRDGATPASAAPTEAASAAPTRRATRPRAPRAAPAKPRVARARTPRKPPASA